ncbi:MAG: acyl-ACP--UDP-N-acetylglucosamine O-acyltransferase [Pseudomonadota bacterium]
MIHPTAIVDPTSHVAKGVKIGAYTIIGPQVEIGVDTVIGPHVVINGPTKIGVENQIFQFASIGEAPQDKKFRGESSHLEIGDRNIVREFVTISRGTMQGGLLTKIGCGNLLMAYVHIAHDCIVGDENTFANNASLAGHVKVGNYTNLGGFVGVHQFCEIGDYSFSAGGSIIVKNVPPYVMVAGYPAEAHGLNLVGLKRRGFTDEVIAKLKKAYRIFYRQGLTTEEALALIQAEYGDVPEVQAFVHFVRNATRSVTR